MSPLLAHWSFDPALLVVTLVVLAHEVGLARLRARSGPAGSRRRRLRSLWFYAGLALFLLAVLSPMDYWSDAYFWVHMLQHIVLMFYVPMLVVAGAPWVPLMFCLPVSARRSVVRWVMLAPASGPLRAARRALVRPWTALILFNAVMVVWHLPGPFELAAENQFVHVTVAHASFLIAGVLFWLQIIPSHPHRPHASPLWQAGAIVSTNVVMFVLAMSMSIFSAHSWYPSYDHVAGVTLSPFADQQIGAAILWVCGDFWAIPALIVVIRRAIDQDGGLGEAVDRVLRRDPTATLGEARR